MGLQAATILRQLLREQCTGTTSGFFKQADHRLSGTSALRVAVSRRTSGSINRLVRLGVRLTIACAMLVAIAFQPIAVSAKPHAAPIIAYQNEPQIALVALMASAFVILLLVAVGILLFSYVQMQGKLQHLRDRQQLISAIMETSPALIYVSNLATQTNTYSNHGLERLLGYSAQDIQALGLELFARLIHPDDLSKMIAFQSQIAAIKGDDTLETEYRMRNAAGHWVWLHSYERAFQRNTDGSLKQRIGIAIDITERKQAEEALRESEARYLLISSVASDYMFSTRLNADGQLKITWVAGAFEAITGYTVEEYIAHGGWRATVHLDDLAIDDRDIEKLQANQRVVTEIRVLTKSGHVRWVRGHAHPIVDANNKELIGIYGAVQDISDRKHAEEALQRRYTTLTAIYQASQRLQQLNSTDVLAQEIIAVLEDMLHYTYGAVLLVNDSNGMLEPFALSAQNHGTRFIAQDKAFIRSKGVRIGTGITGWVAEHGQTICIGDVREDPRYFAVREDIRSELCVPLWLQDRVIGVVNVESIEAEAYSADDQRLLETIAAQISVAIQNARLLDHIQRNTTTLEKHVAERTAELLATNKELESFSYSVSHDLRAPLRAISGFAEIIARRHRADLNEEGQHYVDNIVQASKRMGELIDDLLMYSRLGRGGVRRRPVALSEICEALTSDFTARIADINGTLIYPDDLPTVLGDKTLLTQIMTNLLENAITYHKPGIGPRVDVSYLHEGNSIILRVNDNGIGIPPEYQDKIFSIFQRLHSQDEYPGTGIGLATVKKAVDLLGGEVWVESKVDEGSTFFLKLPKE